jgi:hypothetical protein
MTACNFDVTASFVSSFSLGLLGHFVLVIDFSGLAWNCHCSKFMDQVVL